MNIGLWIVQGLLAAMRASISLREKASVDDKFFTGFCYSEKQWQTIYGV